MRPAFQFAMLIQLATASDAQVPNTNEQPAVLEAGLWKTKLSVVEFNGTSTVWSDDSEMALFRREMLAQRQTDRQCLTPEQAREPISRLIVADPENCDYSSAVMADGIISGSVTCNAPPDEDLTLHLDGHYTATRAEVVVTYLLEDKGNGSITVKLRGRHRRIGDCRRARQ